MNRSRPWLLHSVVLLLAIAPGQAQDVSTGGRADPVSEREVAAQRARSESLASTIRLWVDDFNRGALKPAGYVHVMPDDGPEYMRVAMEAKLFRRHQEGQRRTHFSVLQSVVGLAEMYPSRAVAAALLRLAASGFSRNLYAHRVVLVRDVGHFALLRTEDTTVWHYLSQVAAGRADRGSAIEAEDESATTPRAVGISQRVSALRLLGMNKNPVFRSTVEKCLAAADSRVRLAAAEALSFMAHQRSLSALSRATASERHPVVAQALVIGVERILRRREIDGDTRADAVRSLLPLLGRVGWRNDLGIVRLLRRQPVAQSIDALIQVLRDADRAGDTILAVINKKASPLLAHEAWLSLRQLTGALLPADADEWQRFWQREKGRLVLVEPRQRRQQGATSSVRGTFYGIPVIGREVVFVIDTSSSMSASVEVVLAVPVKRKDFRQRRVSRLDVAKEQVLNAVQGIGKGTRYHLTTFSDDVEIWNAKPVPARPATHRTLNNVLSQLEAGGGTNIFAALLYVLKASQITYGQEIKNDVDEVFILSDGEPSVGQVQNVTSILRSVREMNRYQKVRINTVFAGDGRGPA